MVNKISGAYYNDESVIPKSSRKHQQEMQVENTTSSRCCNRNYNQGSTTLNSIEEEFQYYSSKQSIASMIPNFHLKFAPCNENLKRFLMSVSLECYEWYTTERDMMMTNSREKNQSSSLFENLSTSQQLNMVTNYIVNYCCFDVNGSVLTRKFVKNLDSQNMHSIVFEKENYLKEDPLLDSSAASSGDLLNSFVTLRFILSMLKTKLENEIETYGFHQISSKERMKYNNIQDDLHQKIFTTYFENVLPEKGNELIDVESEEEKGTIFERWLPMH